MMDLQRQASKEILGDFVAKLDINFGFIKTTLTELQVTNESLAGKVLAQNERVDLVVDTINEMKDQAKAATEAAEARDTDLRKLVETSEARMKQMMDQRLQEQAPKPKPTEEPPVSGPFQDASRVGPPSAAGVPGASGAAAAAGNGNGWNSYRPRMTESVNQSGWSESQFGNGILIKGFCEFNSQNKIGPTKTKEATDFLMSKIPEGWKGVVTAEAPYSNNHQLKFFVHPPTSDNLFAARSMMASVLSQANFKINGRELKVSVEDSRGVRDKKAPMWKAKRVLMAYKAELGNLFVRDIKADPRTSAVYIGHEETDNWLMVGKSMWQVQERKWEWQWMNRDPGCPLDIPRLEDLAADF